MSFLKPKNLALAGLIALAPALAAAAATTAIESCTKLTDEKERLACFDKEVAAQIARESHGVAGAGGVTPSDSAPTASGRVKPPKLTEEQKMGLDAERVQKLEASADAPAPIKTLTARIQSVATNVNGREVFTLENGQVWRQVELDAKFSVHPGDTVVIEHGALGSFWLSANVHSHTHVTRVH